MEGLEKLGAFYLGKEYDLKKKKILDRPVMYDARDLTTHAVCVGMTGSGKTGLCIALLEEAAIDNVPAIIIDPKGDITNLLLNFPKLQPEDFQPWINVDDARRKGMSVEEYSKKVATDWSKGLAQWDEGPERIQRLKDSAEFLIYTPGSDAGLPVNILHSFDAPELDWEENEEILRDKIQGTVSAILGLVGIEADPVRSREHILLSNIFEHSWRNGEDMDLAKLILLVQDPPMRKLGVFDLNTFFPEKNRFELAMALNSLIAATGFERWLEGQPLEIGEILHGPNGKPRMAIFYTAHLNDAERMFFVTLLLQQVLTWMRSQPGTTSLRALIYFDEVFGYLPPVGEPPSKRPLLTLLKQARAFGLGVMLTTQNPVDLDYKGLTNAGTWFIGKLQTERDKGRVLEGIESVASSSGTAFNRNYLDKLISSLGSRVFLLHNVHEDEPVIFYTRWVMSYLRGPLTRLQVKELMKDIKKEEMVSVPSKKRKGKIKARAAALSKEELPPGLSPHRPTLSPSLEQVFLPTQISLEQAVRQLEKKEGGPLKVREDRLVYEPALLGMATIHFINRKYDLDESRKVALLLEAPESRGLLKWDEAESLDIAHRDLADKPFGEALFSDVPGTVSDAKRMKTMEKDFADYLYRNQTVELYYHPALKLYSQPNETKREFTVRCSEAAREKRDAEVDKLSEQYESKIENLEDKLAREERALAEDEAEYSARKREELISAGETVIGMFMSRRRSRSISTAARKRRITRKAKADIKESEAAIADLKEDIAKLEEELKEKAKDITSSWDDALKDIDEIRITPHKTDIDMELFALAWAPQWEITYKDASGKERTDDVPAYTS
ncbi:MAG: helicase HerA domain-containing protein [Candidatus Lokiarchaeia archaeon]